MKGIVKDVFIVWIVVCVFCSVLSPAQGHAEITDTDRKLLTEGEEKIEYLTCGNFLYSLNGDNAVIHGYIGDGVTKVKLDTLEIPSEVDGHPVTEIGEYAFYDNRIVTTEGEKREDMFFFDKLLVSKGIKIIHKRAFAYSKVKKVCLPDTVKQIDYAVFYECRKLQNINFPNEVKTIDASSFANCVSLKRIKIPKGCKYINYCAFGNCINLEKVILNEGVMFIDEDAFYECNNLQEIEIPDSVNEIGESAFWNSSMFSKKKYKVIMRSMDTKMNEVSFGYPNLELYAYPGADVLKHIKEDKECTIHYMKPSLSAKKMKVKKGEETRLVMYGARKKVRWTVKNPKVVKLSYHGGKRRNITVKGKKKGTTMVTATYKGKTYQCEVRVK